MRNDGLWSSFFPSREDLFDGHLLSTRYCSRIGGLSVKDVTPFPWSLQNVAMASECTGGDFLLLVGDQFCSSLSGGALETPTLSCSNKLLFKRSQNISFMPSTMFSAAKEMPTTLPSQVPLGSLLPAWILQHPLVRPLQRFTHCSRHPGFSRKTVSRFYFKEHPE